MFDDIIILANSRKNGGRCIAGKNLEGQWRRLVKPGDRPIPDYESNIFSLGNMVSLHGIAPDVSLNNYHSENVRYSIARLLSRDNEISDLLDEPESIFGVASKISYDQAQRLTSSLLFVRVKDLSIYTTCYYQKKKVRCDFVYNNISYCDLPVTDSYAESHFKNSDNNNDEVYPSAYVTVSLGEVYQGYAYKLVSGIFIPKY